MKQTTVYEADGLAHRLVTRTHPEGRYVAHQVQVGEDRHVTLYVNRNSEVISVDVGTRTLARLRVGDSPTLMVQRGIIGQLLGAVGAEGASLDLSHVPSDALVEELERPERHMGGTLILP